MKCRVSYKNTMDLELISSRSNIYPKVLGYPEIRGNIILIFGQQRIPQKMNSKEFVESGSAVLEYLAAHHDNIGDLNVMPSVEPGFLKDLIASEAPIKGENFENILDDVKSKIVPGLVHWHHPNFYAYYPVGNSYPSVLGELMIAGLGGLAFSWMTSPAYTELETIVVKWYAKAMDLPLSFYSGEGGGVIQNSSTESTLVCLMAARDRTIVELKKEAGDVHESVFLSKLVAYTSSMAHSSIEKAARIVLVQLRILEADSHGRLDGESLRKAIAKDVASGLTPFFVVATVGTTASCAFDNLLEIGKVCKMTPSIWFHVDGAYGGSTFILPEMRHFMNGLELADSFITNPNKHMLVNYDASCMYVKDVRCLQSALTVNPIYLQLDRKSEIDYRNYGIPLGRRSRALKLWFVFRMYGIEGIQRYMRNHNVLAKHFEQLVRDDRRFEVVNDVHLGLVCFRLVDTDLVNRELLSRINLSGKYHLVPAMISGKYSIRFCLTYEHANQEHIDNAWAMIQESANAVLETPSIKDSANVKLLTRLSFTSSVSKEMLDRHSKMNGLTDVTLPVIVVE